MLKLFREENIIYKLMTLAVLAAAVFFVCKIVYAGILALPYPKELLEPSNIMLTNQLLEGRNPYALSILSETVPGVNYDYAFLGSIIAAAIAKITGCSAITAHFVISLFSILSTGVIGFLTVRTQTRTTVAPCLASMMFMFCHWRFGYISAAPDDLGLLLFVLTLYLAVCPKIKHKPLITAIGITLCFYTKQYFVFVAAPIFIYMLFYSRKEAVKLLAWTIIINVAVGALITVFWPLYWTKAFLFTYLGTVIGGGGALSTLIDQLEYLAVLFTAVFVILIFVAVMAVVKIIRGNDRLKSIKIIENDPFSLHAVAVVVMLLPLFVLGRNDGAFLSYFLQLWMPSVTVVTLIGIERIDYRRYERLFVLLYAVFAASTIYFGNHKLPLHILTEVEISNWNKALEYTRKYSESGDIFYSRSLSYDGFLRGNGEWICDHDGEVSKYTVDQLIIAGVPDAYTENAQQLVTQNLRYREKMIEKAKNREYSLITFETSPRQQVFNEESAGNLGYSCIDRLELQLGNMPYEVAFYVPDT